MERKEAKLTGDNDLDEILEACIKTLKVKGDDYTIGTGDRLHNFRTAAEFTGLTKEQVLGTYFYKHISALFAYIKSGGQSESEPIEGRIVDVINYALLFAKMVAENQRLQTPKVTQVSASVEKPASDEIIAKWAVPEQTEFRTHEIFVKKEDVPTITNMVDVTINGQPVSLNSFRVYNAMDLKAYGNVPAAHMIAQVVPSNGVAGGPYMLMDVKDGEVVTVNKGARFVSFPQHGVSA